MLLQSEGFESLWVIRIAFAIFEFCAKEWFKSVTQRFESFCLTFSLQLQFVKGFESITRRFESPCLVLHNSRFRDSNHCVGDSNPCFNLYTCSSWGIRITVWVIRISGSQLLFFLYQGFESLDWRFESVNLTTLLEFGFESLHEGFELPLSV